MTMNDKTIKDINTTYGGIIELSVVNGISDTVIVKNNFAVCTVPELSDMIRSLTKMKEAIEEATGIIA